MDSEKTTLSEQHSAAELETEYNQVLLELRQAIFRQRPSDVYQFCACHFQQKLGEQREGLLELARMNPGILNTARTSSGGGGGGPMDSSTAAATVGTSTGGTPSTHQDENPPRETGPSSGEDEVLAENQAASEHAWGGGASGSMFNPEFSFGKPSNMDMDEDEEEEARDKFTSLVSAPPAGVMPFAGRRFSVSAESMNPTTEPEYKKKFVPKTNEQKRRIKEALESNFLFKNLDEDSYRDVVDAMEEKKVSKGHSVIEQGGVGDYFYIVERGKFEIFVRRVGTEPTMVATVEDNGSFGELALMYNAPRAATVTATTDSTLWALDRITFRSLLMERTSRKRRLYERFLETVPLLKSLQAYERQKIADALESVTYEDGSTIVKQGDQGDDFFLIEQGSVRVYKTDEGGVTREYPSLTHGGYFGELALLDNQARQATLVANGRTKCARMSKDAFDRLLGPVINIIRREANNYVHIQSLTSVAAA